MPISANATITVRTVAETIAIALTFIIGNDVANALLLLTENKVCVGVADTKNYNSSPDILNIDFFFRFAY